MERNFVCAKKSKNVARIVKGLLSEGYHVLLTNDILGDTTIIEWKESFSSDKACETIDEAVPEYSIYQVVVLDWDKTYICMATDEDEAEKKVFNKLNQEYPPITLKERGYQPFDIHDFCAMDVGYALDKDTIIEINEGE